MDIHVCCCELCLFTIRFRMRAVDFIFAGILCFGKGVLDYLHEEEGFLISISEVRSSSGYLSSER